jgi:hypothetical protein
METKVLKYRRDPLYVYIAGPLTAGKRMENVRKAMKVADRILALGHIPFLPHLSEYWDHESPKQYETWMSLDFAWLAKCNVLVRMPGKSLGADREVEFARANGMPVLYTTNDLPLLRKAATRD